MSYTHGNIIPLIGGLAEAQRQAFGAEPIWNASYSAFQNNDQWTKKNFIKTPFYDLDVDDKSNINHVNVVGSVCPCAGLSQLSIKAGFDNTANDWMYRSTEDVLKHSQPDVLWGENAPALSTRLGESVREKLYAIGKESGYTLSLLKTASMHHGVPQVRNRSFFFFWKGDQVPVLEFVKEKSVSLKDHLASFPAVQDEPLRKDIPSSLPLYRFILQKYGKTHAEFVESLTKYADILTYLKDNNLIDEALKFLGEEDSKEKRMLMRVKNKISQNMNFRGGYMVFTPNNKPTAAFVGSVPMDLVHPTEDRFLTLTEMKRIMTLPDSYIFDPGKSLKNLNHLCQNVPTKTALEAAKQVIKHLDGKLTIIRPSGIYIQSFNDDAELVKKSFSGFDFTRRNAV
jgi:site-specific DNA-cytosine methylase